MPSDSRDAVREKYSADAHSYDRWREGNIRGKLLTDHDRYLLWSLLDREGNRNLIVEIGAGTGRFTIPLLKLGNEVVATDINVPMLHRLKEKLKGIVEGQHCSMCLHDVFNLGFQDDSLDFIVCLHVIPRFLNAKDQRAALEEISRAMKPGGHCIINYRNRNSIIGLFYRGHAASRSEIRNMLADAGLVPDIQIARHIINRRLLNYLPLVVGKALSKLDMLFSKTCPTYGWDVFILARKLEG